MINPLNTYDISGTIDDNYGMQPSIKVDIKLTNYKLIPNWSWVDGLVASQMPHNTKGPAFTSASVCLWYVHGTQYYSTKQYSKMAGHDEQTSLNWFLAYGENLPVNVNNVRFLPVEYIEVTSCK